MLGCLVFLHPLLVNEKLGIFLIQGSVGVEGQKASSRKVMYIFVASVGDEAGLRGVGL